MQSGPSLQGLNGRPKIGVRPNELRTARRDAAGEHLHTTIEHTCWRVPGSENKCQSPQQRQQPAFAQHQSPKLDCRVIHFNNTGNLATGPKSLPFTEKILLPSNKCTRNM